MKIKEVIAKTNLTDRAIRLYIENELITPSCSENYSGRKNIEFSEEDAEKLKSIAILRKAGFSISEIKQLQEEGETSREIISQFIDKIEKRVESDMAILNCLKTLVGQEEITFYDVCNSLNTPTAEKNVPKEDLKDDGAIFRGFGYISLGIFLVFVLHPLIDNIRSVRFFNFSNFFGGFGWLYSAILFLSAFMIVINKKHKRKSTKKKEKNTLRVSFTCLTALCLIYPFFILISFLFIALPIYQSSTTKPENYLEVDNYVKLHSQDIYNLFPADIPFSATKFERGGKAVYPETTKYYYYYTFGDTPSYFDIVAQWQLSQEDYDEAKKRAFSESGEIVDEEKKNDWVCCYYDADFNENIAESYYLIFAYNDKTETVRYIISYSRVDSENYEPYYLSLDW